MKINEKLEALELRWKDLARAKEAVEPPVWHNDLLEERASLVGGGSAQFIDWETAKAAIRNNMK